MKQVAVIHTAFEDSPRTVAFVNVGEREGTDALEYAYRVTQNLEGSWSKGKSFEFKGETFENKDYNEDITVMAPLEVVDGVEYGLRSTSVNDQILFGTKKYKVAGFGFEEIV